ncbi:MAG: hypothetical protein UX02_C0001G0349 [Candidatus Moranbacteria bacterium GW2011_GWC1_45_18]|nr:MAG: hypothetical protein UT79_C0002G0048 [Candidatus Moranbacteria bacterium GW2011_GWC2_40_12]KKT33803.1 MAG: hypothetical protein UW19_C0005G0049 [Candidatus Moranbacteria bacterium GW2011_GWF2_44_10]KKU00901.1 MAG: hypothetical protein UX02_C0001G0349 [Candidatus Moranbacteria bacterium GW2011_GWC1_45_18]OGI23695.1 MAG: hypothetical protein A2194_04910 [Candidatus Moranbacteria bacterium RIFOXYA1_FULL_44_8]OGI34718.1 MAG: hypothetical protein A2407_03060 [Candidatus Moranbacteria bacteri
MAGEIENEVYPCLKCISDILEKPENRGMSPSQLKISGNRVRLNGHAYTVGQLIPCRDGLDKTAILGFNNIDKCGHFLTLIEMQSLLVDLNLPSLNLRHPA